jgi:hypothetical protein
MGKWMGNAEAVLEGWGKWLDKAMGPDHRYRVFLGPCAHGRDPYDRCNHCGNLSPEEAKALAEAQPKGVFLTEPESEGD